MSFAVLRIHGIINKCVRIFGNNVYLHNLTTIKICIATTHQYDLKISFKNVHLFCKLLVTIKMLKNCSGLQ